MYEIWFRYSTTLRCDVSFYILYVFNNTKTNHSHTHKHSHHTLFHTHTRTRTPIHQPDSIHRTLDPEVGTTGLPVDTPSLPDPGFRRAEVGRHERLNQWFMDDDELDGLDTIGHSKVSSHAHKGQVAETHDQTVFDQRLPTYSGVVAGFCATMV